MIFEIAFLYLTYASKFHLSTLGRFSFEKIFFRKIIFREHYLSRIFSSEKIFFQEDFLLVSFEFFRVLSSYNFAKISFENEQRLECCFRKYLTQNYNPKKIRFRCKRVLVVLDHFKFRSFQHIVTREQAYSSHGCKVQKVTLLIARFWSLRLLFFKVKGSEYHKLSLQAIFMLKRQKSCLLLHEFQTCAICVLLTDFNILLQFFCQTIMIILLIFFLSSL